MPFTTAQFASVDCVNFGHPRNNKPSTRSALASTAAVLALIGAGAYATVQISHDGGSSTAPTMAATHPAPLYREVLLPIQLSGFSLQADPATVPGATDWAAGERTPSDAVRLQGLGFQAGIAEQLVRPGAHATSIVERFRTAPAAGAELRYRYAKLERGSRPFPVIGIPGARGVRVSTGSATNLAIVFTSGRDYYFVGASSAPHGPGMLTGGELAAAADALYLTVHGCTPRV